MQHLNVFTKELKERIRWWIYHPRFELIYLLGGTPDEHNNTLHYRNIESVVGNLKNNINHANKRDT